MPGSRRSVSVSRDAPIVVRGQKGMGCCVYDRPRMVRVRYATAGLIGREGEWAEGLERVACG